MSERKEYVRVRWGDKERERRETDRQTDTKRETTTNLRESYHNLCGLNFRPL